MDELSNLLKGVRKYRQTAKWALAEYQRGVPPESLRGAIRLASMSEGFKWCCSVDISQLPGVEADRLPEWYERWRKPSVLGRDIVRVILPKWSPLVDELCESGWGVSELQEGLRENCAEFIPLLAKASAEERQKLGGYFLTRHQRAVRRLLLNLDDELDGTDEAALPELTDAALDPLIFFMRIRLPAFAYFKLPHDELYRRAIAGEYKALRAILALDPSLQYEPGIHESMFGKNRRYHNLPIGSQAVPAISRLKRCRASATALLVLWMAQYSKVVAKFCQKLTIESMRKVFGLNLRKAKELTIPAAQRLLDALASDRHGSLTTEEDLPDDPDTLRQVVYRLMKRLPLEVCDILCLESVTG